MLKFLLKKAWIRFQRELMQSKKNLDPQTLSLFLALAVMTMALVYFLKVVVFSTGEGPKERVEMATK